MMKNVAYILRMSILFLAVCISVQYADGRCAEAASAPEKAADFELPDLQGVKHRLSGYRGKVVLINFWASWCRECISEMPSLNSLYEQLRSKDVVVLGVSTDANTEDIKKSVAKTHVTYPILVDRDGGVYQEKFRVMGIPTTVIVDKKGFIAGNLLGVVDFSSAAFLNRIKMLSEEKSR